MYSQLHNIWRSRRRKFMLHRHKLKMCSLYITMKLRIFRTEKMSNWENG